MMTGRAVWHEFPAASALARSLAAAVAAKLEFALGERGRAVLVVSGGRTPGAFLDALSDVDIAWERITVTLADERFVPPSSPRSNEHLVTLRLLQRRAARAAFVGLYAAAPNVGAAARLASQRLAELSRPFDVAVLGMGSDGHTASIFADADDYSALADPASPAIVLPVLSASAGEPRLTLSLPLLVQARNVCLHIEGLAKKELLLACLDDGLRPVPPVGLIFRHARDPVEIYWAPSGAPS
jgi:6-phosphogluconolactonase